MLSMGYINAEHGIHQISAWDTSMLSMGYIAACAERRRVVAASGRSRNRGRGSGCGCRDAGAADGKSGRFGSAGWSGAAHALGPHWRGRTTDWA